MPENHPDTVDETLDGMPAPADIFEEASAVGLSDSGIAALLDALHEDNRSWVESYLHELSEADIAELLSKISEEDRLHLLEEYGDAIAPYVFTEMDAALRRRALEAMPAAKVAAILSELDSDDALDLILDLDADFQKDITRKLSAKTRLAIEEGLTFPEDSAGRMMQREYVAIPETWTVGKTIDYLRAAADSLPDEFYDIIVITPSYHVVGEIPLNRLIRAQRPAHVRDLVLEDLHTIPADMDQEEVAEIFRREDLGSAPVVDTEGRLIGVITVDDIIDVIDEEAAEDILKLAGVTEDGDLYRAVFQTSFARSRWLVVNLGTAFLAASVVSLFGATIEQIVALAALMPIVAGMGGNAGTQALAVAVRAIATRELSSTNARRAIKKEALVGLVNGCIFAVLVGTVTTLWFGNFLLGSVIAMAMVLNLFTAGVFGAGIPILLDKFNQDPAIASSVFLTTITDIVGFFGFLGLATLILL